MNLYDMYQNPSSIYTNPLSVPTSTGLTTTNQSIVPYASADAKIDALSSQGANPVNSKNWADSSLVSNLNTGMNLAGSGLSLYSMLESIQSANLNQDYLRQSMEQSQDAYDYAKQKQENTSSAINSAESAMKSANS